MKNGQMVNVTWGDFKGQQGFITMLNGKNVVLYLIEKKYEVATFSTDILEPIPAPNIPTLLADSTIEEKQVNGITYTLSKIKDYDFYGVLAASPTTGLSLPSNHRYFVTEQQAQEYLNTL